MKKDSVNYIEDPLILKVYGRRISLKKVEKEEIFLKDKEDEEETETEVVGQLKASRFRRRVKREDANVYNVLKAAGRR